MRDLIAALARPFPPENLHWRIGSRKRDKSEGMVLAYMDSRDVMERLDDIHAALGVPWQNEYLPVHNGVVVCRLGLKIDGEWIWKSSGAGETQVEGEKGATSDAFKRAAVQWGIGRYLYRLDAPWVKLDNGYLPRNWKPPQLPKWATPEGFDDGAIPYRFDRVALCHNAYVRNQSVIDDLRDRLDDGDYPAAYEIFKTSGVPQSDWSALMLAPTKGGIFTTDQIAQMKGDDWARAREMFHKGEAA